MVSINESHLNGNGVMYIEGACLSTDSKPTGCAVGSVMIEVNTGKAFLFDGTTWQEVS